MELGDKLVANPGQMASLLGLLLVLRFIHLVVSRLVLSPIAGFPGPKLAGLTFWYEGWYDVVKKGRYTWKIKELHEKYGPIIRINPEEIHVEDPSFYYKLYTGPSERRDKWQWAMKMFGMKAATFSTVSHDVHRRRRAPLNPYFSKAAVTQLEPEIRDKVTHLCRRMQEYQKSGEPIDLGIAYAALTCDVVTGYCFGAPYGCLEAPDLKPDLYYAVQANTQTTALAKQFGWLIPLSRALPEWVVAATNPLMLQMVQFLKYIVGQILVVMEANHNKDAVQPRHTIFQGILDSDLPPREKTIERLMDDGISLVGAGVSTTADTLRITSFHILNRPEVLNRLRAELLTVMPDGWEDVPAKTLEQLPYLSAVVNEGLRISCGISSRLQRVSPTAPLQYKDWIIPPGTPVSMTIYLLHNRPDIYPEPTNFLPERWLKDANGNEPRAPNGERLDHYLIQFAKGSRSCVGLNLAMTEIFLGLAYMFRRLDFELFETTREDVDIQHDFMTAFPKLDTKGVRVLVKGS